MNQYELYLKDVYENGVVKTDRTGTGTKSVFGRQIRFDLREGFPLITTKKVHTKSIIHELLWFLQGSTNIKYLQENGVKIWDEWADENGDLGPVYGAQWRSWPGKVTGVFDEDTEFKVVNGVNILPLIEGANPIHEAIDQIQNAIDTLKNNPDSRRIIVSAWNPAQVDDMKLPPCHALFQFYTEEMTLEQRKLYARDKMGIEVDLSGSYGCIPDVCGVPKKYLSCQLYQRSADSFLGVPFNIASYALLTEMFAQQCNMVAKEFIWTGGDCHIYFNHYEQVQEQLSRAPRAYPTLKINRKPDSIFGYKYEDFEIVDYNPHPTIKAPVAV